MYSASLSDMSPKDKSVIKHGLNDITNSPKHESKDNTIDYNNYSDDNDNDNDNDNDGYNEQRISDVIKEYLQKRGVNPELAQLRAQRLVSCGITII